MIRLPELPLLRRELTELANRRRTYIVRVVGAVIILFFVMGAYENVLMQRQNLRGIYSTGGPEQLLGIGGDVFSQVTPALFTTISLLLPALCCASITSEKESNTIGTLLLTKLSPGTIVVEKFGSRLVPMLTLLLLTFPVLAHVHALGGVDTNLLLGTIWLLLCQCFLVAAMAIMCSSWFSSTVGAFICSYAIVGFFAAMTYSLNISTFVPSAIWNSEFVAEQSRWNVSRAQWLATNGMGSGIERSWGSILFKSIPSLVVTGVLLLLARLVLVRRAFVSHSSLLLKLFRGLDRFFKDLNERTTGGIELIKDSNPPPDNDPVAWRERNKKSFGKPQYLIRILLAIEAPTLFICMLAATSSARSAFEGLYALQTIIWVMCALIVAVKGATLMSSERAGQTLEPLLATPMLNSEILNQKVAGMKRLLIVLAVPILTVNFTHFLLHINMSSLESFFSSLPRPLVYMLLSAACTLIILYLTTWFATGIGMKIHSQTKAVITAVTCMIIWVFTPLLAARFFYNLSETAEVIASASPVFAVRMTEIFLIEDRLQDNLSNYGRISGTSIPAVFLSCISISMNCLVLLVVRKSVLALAPRLLQRQDGLRQQSELPDPAGRIQIPGVEGVTS
jgi:ABC-type transport system involved in multi-copper enzyme maturation permease subunit